MTMVMDSVHYKILKTLEALVKELKALQRDLKK